jgi:outer membrane protein OmpA-like peptidoglycan-associated protein
MAGTSLPPKEPDMTPDVTRYLATVALAIAAALLTPHAKAEKVLVYREGQRVDPQEVAAVLGKTRSITLLDDEPSAAAKPAAVAAIPAAAKPGAVAISTAAAPARASRPASLPADHRTSEAATLSLPVQFAFDSAEILPAARPQLDALAVGIRLLAPHSVVIFEGHTNAIGSDAYNLSLSRARAQAVREYLVHHHGIEATRLKTVAYGESRPIEGSDPNAALNRRVQFRGA